MKKLLLVFCIILSFIIPALPSHAQTLDWSCFTTNGAVLADANDIATVAFTNANCPAANGFSLQIVGTGQLRTLVSNSSPGTNPFIRMSKNGATAVFNYARLFRTSGGLFTLTSISVTPSTVGAPPVGPGPQAITVHAYRSGTEVGTASTAILSTFGLVNIPSSQLGANFANIDEIRFTTSGANGFGVCIDDVVVAVAGNAPSVTTGLASAVTANSATLAGNVSSDGGASLSEKGIVYSSTSSNPTTADAKLTNGTSIGAISVNATGLLSNTNYHFRAYATNVIGTSYGAAQTFKTLVTNTAPVAVADNYNFQTGVTLSVAAPGVLNNDTDADGDPITAVLVSGPSNGTLVLNPNGSFNYTPSGTTADQFTYKVNDGKVDGNTVMVTLTHANAAPVLAATAGTTLFSGADALIDPGITVTDDGNVVASGVVSIIGGFHSPEDELALMRDVSMGDIVGFYDRGTGVLLLQSPSGTATIAQWQATLRRVVYRNGQGTPTVNTRTISFLVSDGSLNSNTVTKTVSIALPVAVADNYIYQSGTALTIAAPGVLGNDTSPGGSPLSAVLVTGPANGTLVLNPNGSFTYTSTGATSDQFTYKVNNGNLDGNTVAVTLTRGNSSPVAVNDSYTVTTNTPFSGNVFNNDSDPDGDQLLITANTSPAHGTLVLNPNGSFTYTPNSTVGDDTFNYQVCDNGIPSLCSSATVVFHVSAPANQPPVLTTTAGATIFTGASAVAIDNAITVTDLDDNTLASAFIEITHGFHPGDVLGFTASGATGNITGSYDSTNGILPLTSAGASATLAQWQAALRSVTYQSTAAVPNTDTRLISFGTNDGNKASATVTKNITIAVPVISTTGTLSALTTTYGKASSSGTFNVSGVSLGAGILVTAPTGFEVSKDNITFSNTVIVGSTGTIPSTPVHIRLAAGIIAGNYSGNVVLSSTGATSVNVATVASTVNKAPLTITASIGQNKIYGNVDPTLTYAITTGALVGTDVFTGSLTRVPGENFGTYAIQQGTLALSNNYTLTYVGANFTINKAAITLTADTKNKVYGDADPVLTFKITSGTLKFADTFTGSLTRAPGENVGTYAIQQGSLALSSNYMLTYIAGNIVVTPASLTITANNKGKAFGQTLTGGPGSAEFTSSGLVGSETVGSVTITYGTGASASAPANTYTGSVVASAATGGTFNASNYSINYVAGNITVGQAVLTITANNANKVYGALVPTLTVSYSGFIGTDNASSLTTQPTINTTAVAKSPVNTYPITVSGAVSSNYTIVYNPGILTVTPAQLTIAANSNIKVYGAPVPALAVSYSGFVGTDDASSLTTQPTISTTVTTNSPVNTYPITASGAVSSNYTFIYKPGTLTVTPAALTITANNATKVYGGAVPALSVSYSGFVGTDDASSLTSQPTISTTAVTNSPVNTYPITASGAVSSNYTFIYQPGILTVTRASLTITANNKGKAFGQAITGGPGSTAFTSTGLVSTETIGSVTITYGTGAAAGAPANTYTGSVVASVATGGTFNASNYNITYVAGNITVGQTVLTITANNATKTYGAAVPILTVSYSGFVGTDDASSLTTQPIISTTAVTNSPVNTYAITASGAVSSNYIIVYKPGTLAVTPAILTITANNATKIYGSVNPALSVNYSGFVGADNASSLTTAPTVSITAVTSSPVNTYPITASGAVSSNYTFVYKPGVLTVTPAALTITANNATKTYGSANPVLSVSYSGFVGTDNASSLTTVPVVSTTAVTNSPVNTYPIAASGAVSPNYSFVYKPGVLTITKAVLNIAANNATKTYGSVNPALSVSYGGFVGTDNSSSLTTAPTVSTTAVTNSPVNTYPITASGAVSANYTFIYKPGILTVTTATLTITANNATKTYGSANPTLGVSYNGFVGTDNAASLTTAPTVNTTAVTNSPVNTYPITASGATSLNYTFIYKPGILTVTTATLTITANNATKTYGSANPTLGVSYSGFVGTDNASSLTTAPTVSTTAVTNSPVNTYPITASGAASLNYTIIYKPGVLTVTPAALTITANNKTKSYGQTLTGGVGSTAFTSTGLVGSETIGSVTITYGTGAAAGATVNTYAGSVVASAATGGTFTSGNYQINYVAGDVIVGKSVLTITANNTTKVYGSANPALSVSYSGFVGTDNASSLTTAPAVSTTAVTNSPVNTYPITTSGAVSANYTIVYKPGILTVTPAALTITANSATKTYGSANPTLGVSYSGFVGSDNASSLTTAPTVSTTAVTNSPVNTYPITASGAVSSNYTIVYKPGVLTITQVALTITANNKTKTYGETLTGGAGNTAFTSTGLVNSETIGSVTITYGTGAAAGAAVNTYTGSVVASAATGGTFTPGNYHITYVAGNIVVSQITLTITANSQSKIYGAANPVLSVSYNGFINGDNSTSLTTKPSLSTVATSASAAGTYPITASGAAIANYKIVYVAGTLTINKATLTITADNKSRLYGTANPALTAIYSGFVNKDDEADLTTRPILTTAANTTSAPGVYPISVNGAVSPNYNFIYIPGKLTVTPISNANLINLSLSSGILSPAFTSGNLAYTTQIDNDVDHIRLTLTFDATATARVNGTSTQNGRPSYSIPLNAGNNTITIVVTAQDHTTTNTYTVVVYRGADQKDLVVTNILTPNGDGKNDTWLIQDIQLYPNNVVTVYDRGGRVVYTKRGYTNDWNGMYSGSPLTEGTYYYVVDLGPQQRKFKGYITIVRNR